MILHTSLATIVIWKHAPEEFHLVRSVGILDVELPLLPEHECLVLRDGRVHHVPVFFAQVRTCILRLLGQLFVCFICYVHSIMPVLSYMPLDYAFVTWQDVGTDAAPVVPGFNNVMNTKVFEKGSSVSGGKMSFQCNPGGKDC